MKTRKFRNGIRCVALTFGLVAITAALLGPQAQVAMGQSGKCFNTTHVPGSDVSCVCNGGSCPAESRHQDPYDVCDGGTDDSGYAFCNNSMQAVGWTAACTGGIIWSQYTACLLNAAACGAFCAAAAAEGFLNPIADAACFGCLATYGHNCTGCKIWQCTEGSHTELDAMKVSSSGGTCP